MLFSHVDCCSGVHLLITPLVNSGGEDDFREELWFWVNTIVCYGASDSVSLISKS